MASNLDALASRAPSAEVFAELTKHLGSLRGKARSEAIARAEALLASWPDDAREAPGAWKRICKGQQAPFWWPLVRHVRVKTGETLDVGEALAPLTSVDASDGAVDVAPLARALRLRSLDVSANESIERLDFLAGMPDLERLSVARPCARLDLTPILALPRLRELDLSYTMTFVDAGLLRPLRSLAVLDLSATGCGGTLERLAELPELGTLLVEDFRDLEDLAWVSALPKLTSLMARRLDEVVDLRGLASGSLRSLTLGGARLRNLSDIAALGALEELAIVQAPAVADLSFLKRLRTLRILGIEGCAAPLPDLDLPALESVDLSWTDVSDLAPIAPARSLRQLRINGSRLDDLTPLGGLERLEVLELTNCRDLGDLMPVKALPLRMLSLVGSEPLPAAVPVPPGCEVFR